MVRAQISCYFQKHVIYRIGSGVSNLRTLILAKGSLLFTYPFSIHANQYRSPGFLFTVIHVHLSHCCLYLNSSPVLSATIFLLYLCPCLTYCLVLSPSLCGVLPAANKGMALRKLKAREIQSH